MTTRRRLKSVREARLMENKDFRRLIGYVFRKETFPSHTGAALVPVCPSWTALEATMVASKMDVVRITTEIALIVSKK
jgi:hypothetical protein